MGLPINAIILSMEKSNQLVNLLEENKHFLEEYDVRDSINHYKKETSKGIIANQKKKQMQNIMKKF